MKPSCRSRLLSHCSQSHDPQFLAQLERLHHLFVVGRWVIVIVMWLLIGIVSVWSLRHEFDMVSERFTWAALRYGLAFNIWSTLGLSICIGPTVALLVWQTRNILFGLPKPELARLEKYVIKVREQGESHPLWAYIGDRPTSSSSSNP